VHAVLVAKLVELEVQRGGHLAARHLEPEHERIGLFLAFGALLAVVLLVRAVVLEDLVRVLSRKIRGGWKTTKTKK
jgi:hypothetical protein